MKPFRQLFLPLISYPEPIPAVALSRAVAFAAGLTEQVDAVALRAEIPVQSNRLAEMLIHLRDLARAEEAKSREACLGLLEQVRDAADAQGVSCQTHIVGAEIYDTPDSIARLARTRDAVVAPLTEPGAGVTSFAEAVIFGSGRPVFLLPATGTPRPAETVAIAWDGGRAAARAVADAMPVIKAAVTVRIVVIVNEKASATADTAVALVKHLAHHGVDALVDDVDAQGKPIGEALRRGLRDNGADLLVMGAFGHNRLREFILGGATQSILEDPPMPVMLSH